MSSLTLNFPEKLAVCVLVGHCHKADLVWTRDQFLAIEAAATGEQ
jgi:hypothetical protein